MHILYTMSGWTEAGGGTMRPRERARAMARRGRRISVLYTEEPTGNPYPPYEVVKTQEDSLALYCIRNVPGFAHNREVPERDLEDSGIRSIVSELLALEKPDIVHFQNINSLSLGIIEEVRRAGIPSVFEPSNYWAICPRMYLFRSDLSLCPGPSADGSNCAECFHSPERQPLYAARIKRAVDLLNRQVNRHLALSKRAREIFIQNGCSPGLIHVLHPQSETVDLIWRKLGGKRQGTPSPSPLKIGFMGNLFAWKGAHVLIEALQAFEPGEVECHIFGDGPAPYKDSLRRLDRKGLTRFCGQYRHAQLPSLLDCVDIMAVPSLCEETAGMVVMEALAARVPVVASRIGGIPDFVEEGVNGFLFDPGSAAGLASIVEKFLLDPALLSKMQKRIGPPAGFDSYLNRLLGHYEEVIGEERGKRTLMPFPHKIDSPPLLVARISPTPDGNGIDYQYRASSSATAMTLPEAICVIDLTSFHPRREEVMEAAHVLVLNNPCDPDLLPLIRWRKKQGKLTVYELNDDPECFPLSSQLCGFQNKPEQRLLIQRLAAYCDLLQFGSEELADKYRHLNQRWALFSNRISEGPAPRWLVGQCELGNWEGKFEHGHFEYFSSIPGARRNGNHLLLAPAPFERLLTDGLLTSKRREKEKALRMFEEASRIEPRSYLPYLFAAHCCSQEAIAMLQEALERNPSSLMALLLLGEELSRKGRIRNALDSYRKAAEVFPAYELPYLKAAYLLHGAGLKREAVSLLRKARDLIRKTDITVDKRSE